MNRGDEAAFPHTVPRVVNKPVSTDNPLDRGMTKLEYAAIMIAAGLISVPAHKAETGLAEEAVKYAKCLFNELAK